MKTRQLLTFFMTIVAVMLVSVTFAQENASWIDMTEDENTTDSVVVGAEMPYYVQPDDAINNLTTQYDPSTAMEDQGIISTFEWAVVTATGTVTLNDPSTADGENAPYQTVTFPSAAEDGIEIGVSEVAPGGECSGDQVTTTINVIEEPSFTVNEDGSQNINVCTGTLASIKIASIGADGIDGTSNYYFLTDVSQRMVDSDGSDIGSVGDYPHTDSLVSAKASSVNDVTILEDYLFTCGENNGSNQITEYTFDFSKGINNHISRKSDYLDFATTGTIGNDDRAKEKPSADDSYATNYSWYGPSTGEGITNTVTVTVYPQPTTGNIYHVGNKFEL